MQDALQTARMREVVTIVAGVDDDGQPALDDLVQVHEPRVVHVHLLGVGMDLHALQSQINGAVDLTFHVFEILVHSSEANEVVVGAALLGDEVVDDRHLPGRRGHGMHQVMGDGRAFARREHRGRRSILCVQVDAVEIAHGRGSLAGDLVGINVGMGINDGHSGSF